MVPGVAGFPLASVESSILKLLSLQWMDRPCDAIIGIVQSADAWIGKLRVSLPYVASNTQRGRLQATLGAWSTVGLLVVVNAFWGVALLAGEAQISGINLLIFNTGGFVIIGWLGLSATSDKLGGVFAPLTGEAQVIHRGLDRERAGIGCLSRALTNLWIPVTFQFCLATWLIYASGGLTNSPFVSVPVTMMIIGQSVYHVPSIGLCVDPRLCDIGVFAWRVIRFYAYPQLVFASMLIVLGLLQIYHPLQTHAAPTAETIFASQLSLSIGMCVAFIVRRTDRSASRVS